MSVARRREREKEARRGQILDAADAVFSERGVALATMDEIAARAELSKGTLYLYFRSKDELFLATVVRTITALEAELAHASEAKTGLEELRLRARAHLRFAVRHADRFRIALAWLSGGFQVDASAPNFAEYQTAVARLHGHATTAIVRGQKDGTVRADIEPLILGLQAWAAMLGVIILGVNAAELQKRMPFDVRVSDVIGRFDEFLTQALAPLQGPTR